MQKNNYEFKIVYNSVYYYTMCYSVLIFYIVSISEINSAFLYMIPFVLYLYCMFCFGPSVVLFVLTLCSYLNFCTTSASGSKDAHSFFFIIQSNSGLLKRDVLRCHVVLVFCRLVHFHVNVTGV